MMYTMNLKVAVPPIVREGLLRRINDLEGVSASLSDDYRELRFNVPDEMVYDPKFVKVLDLGCEIGRMQGVALAVNVFVKQPT